MHFTASILTVSMANSEELQNPEVFWSPISEAGPQPSASARTRIFSNSGNHVVLVRNSTRSASSHFLPRVVEEVRPCPFSSVPQGQLQHLTLDLDSTLTEFSVAFFKRSFTFCPPPRAGVGSV